MTNWLKALVLYKDPRILGIFFLSFSSGLPFLLILSTLTVWLTESGITKTQIGLLAWVTIPYSFKFLWAPFIDSYQIPFLCRVLGKRRGWMVFSQLMLFISLISLGLTNPQESILKTSICALIVGFFSATQDISIEAYRIEALPRRMIGHAASTSVLGYRMGMLFSGAGALYVAAFFNSWAISYTIMACSMFVGIIATLMSPEPKRKNVSQELHMQLYLKNTSPFQLFKDRLESVLISPFKSFIQGKNWITVIPFILFFKIGDTVLNTMSMPFLIEMGFSKVELAHVAKTFGISAMIFGGILGALLLNRFPLRFNLMICTSLQIMASSFFMIQAHLGYDLSMLFVTMGIENLACGMSQVALIAYLSSLCQQPHTGTHYAVVSSFASFSRVTLSCCAGWLADQISWFEFYQYVSFACLPTFLLLLFFTSHFKKLEFSVAGRT